MTFLAAFVTPGARLLPAGWKVQLTYLWVRGFVPCATAQAASIELPSGRATLRMATWSAMS